MGKVYAPPVEIKHPEFTAKDYFKAEENYINAVVAWANHATKGKHLFIKYNQIGIFYF